MFLERGGRGWGGVGGLTFLCLAWLAFKIGAGIHPAKVQGSRAATGERRDSINVDVLQCPSWLLKVHRDSINCHLGRVRVVDVASTCSKK